MDDDKIQAKKEEFEKFLPEVKKAILSAFEYASNTDDPALMVYVVGTSRPKPGEEGQAGAVVQVVHNMNLSGIADTLIGTMKAGQDNPEMPLSHALALMVQNADALKAHTKGLGCGNPDHNHGVDDDDEFPGGIYHL